MKVNVTFHSGNESFKELIDKIIKIKINDEVLKNKCYNVNNHTTAISSKKD